MSSLEQKLEAPVKELPAPDKFNHLEVTQRVRQILSDPNRWAQTAFFLDRQGNSVYRWEHAEKVCLLGARRLVLHCNGMVDDSDIYAQKEWARFLGFEPFEYNNAADMAIHFNDSGATTHADVLAVLDKALAKSL